jgi:uridine kinase
MPLFDFLAGKPKKETEKLSLPKDSILVLEGIHCMNDKLTCSIDPKNKFKIFVAPFSQLNIDETFSVWNSVNRLLRRMIRDFQTRGYSPEQTLKRWPSVRKSEHKFIFPFMYFLIY